MSLRKTTLLGAVAALALPAAATAATGTIDAVHTTADFSGSFTEPVGLYDAAFSSPVVIVAGNSYDTCDGPWCEEHTLTIAPGAARLQIDATSDAQKLDFELVDPTGYKLDVNNGTVGNRSFTWEDPVAGQWTIRVWGVSGAPSSSYDLKATYVPPETP
jgi:hypothetical protein